MKTRRGNRLIAAIAAASLMWAVLAGPVAGHVGFVWHTATHTSNCSKLFQGWLTSTYRPHISMKPPSGSVNCPLGEMYFRFYEAGYGYHYDGPFSWSGTSEAAYGKNYNAYAVWDGFAGQARVYQAYPYYSWSSWYFDLVF